MGRYPMCIHAIQSGTIARFSRRGKRNHISHKRMAVWRVVRLGRRTLVNKWQRVLDRWSSMGRIGLTIQQLSYITGISGQRLLKQLRRDKRTRWQICNNICAPVVGWVRFTEGFNFNRADVLAEVLLNAYPTPRYKGVLDWKGTTSSHRGMSRSCLTTLRDVMGED